MKLTFKILVNTFIFLWVANIFSQDFSGPEITSLTLSPTNVDLSTGSVTVTASIQVYLQIVITSNHNLYMMKMDFIQVLTQLVF